MQKLRGVNLGGWLVAERWMTPKLFHGTDARDEYSLLQRPDGPKWLKKHQKEFITEEDFKWLAANGLNAVRIPIGYWIISGDAPFIACIERLDWAMKMAKKHKLQVVISMHGAPGSQNGRDHSGRIGKSDWYKNNSHREKTIEVLEEIAKRYADNEYLWGIELLNEPKVGVFQLKLRRFHQEAYNRVSKAARPGTNIIFHDAFTPRLMTGAVGGNNRNPVVMDIHWYHFSFLLHRVFPINWYYRFVDWRRNLILQLNRQQQVIIGEWSMVISSEAFKRHPKEKHQSMMDEHARIQQKAYEPAAGWFYWTYKTEDRGLWHFRSMVEDGRISLE